MEDEMLRQRLLTALMIATLVLLGCVGGRNSPVAPDPGPPDTTGFNSDSTKVYIPEGVFIMG